MPNKTTAAAFDETPISMLRTFTRGAYDLQQLRIQAGNRLCASFRVRLGIKPSTKEEDADKEAQKVLKILREEFDRITDGVKRDLPSRQGFKPSGIIHSYSELCIINQYISLNRQEESHFRRLEGFLDGFPIWDQYLKNLSGCGPAMSAVLIISLDPHKAETPSSFWKYAGMDLGPDGTGRSRREEHLIKVKYVAKDGTEKEKNSITFNPFLKTKLRVLASCLIRTKNGKYKSVYDGYKHRLENHPNWVDKTPLHRHNASLRYMVKIFLLDLWTTWRTIEGLPVRPSYQEEKLGHKHSHAA